MTHPDVKTYAEEGSDADLITAIYNTLLFAAFLVALSVVQTLILTHGQLGFIFYLFFIVMLAMLASVAGLFIGATILYLLAKTIGGGKGSYTTQTYIFSMYNTPLAIVAALFGALGQWGAILGYAVGIYELFLTYIMLRAIHQCSPPRAVLSVISYGVIVTLLVILFIYLQISSALQVR